MSSPNLPDFGQRSDKIPLKERASSHTSLPNPPPFPTQRPSSRPPPFPRSPSPLSRPPSTPTTINEESRYSRPPTRRPSTARGERGDTPTVTTSTKKSHRKLDSPSSSSNHESGESSRKKKGSAKRRDETSPGQPGRQQEESGSSSPDQINHPSQKKADTEGAGRVKNVKKEKQARNSSHSLRGPLHHLNKSLGDFEDQILTIHLHYADSLRPQYLLRHPLVRVHVIDATTGTYFKKSDPKRNVTTSSESKTLDFILPMLSKPFDLTKDQKLLRPKWNEKLILNDKYSHFIHSNCVLFFEILDFTTVNVGHGDPGWNYIAWAFLKIVSSDKIANTQKSMKLQLYKYPRLGGVMDSVDKLKETNNPIPYVYHCWLTLQNSPDKMESMRAHTYPSTLFVTVAAMTRPDDQTVMGRALLPTETEAGKLTLSQLLVNNRMDAPDRMKSLLDLNGGDENDQFKWRRQENEECNLPNKPYCKIDCGSGGAIACAFSSTGRFFAVGCAADANATPGNAAGGAVHAWVIKLYTFPACKKVAVLKGHQETIYQLQWSPHGDHWLLSASGDGSARLWEFREGGGPTDSGGLLKRQLALYHPSFVYSISASPDHMYDCKQVATGAFDGVVRVWYTEANQQADPTNADAIGSSTTLISPKFELKKHKTFVNAVIFDKEGLKLISGDGDGLIYVWVMRDESFDCLKSITNLQGSPITSIHLHPSNRKILVSTPQALLSLDIRVYAILVRYLSLPDGSVTSAKTGLSGVSETKVRHKIASSHAITSIMHPSYSPCGTYVCAGTELGEIRVFRADNGKSLTIFCKTSLPLLARSKKGGQPHAPESIWKTTGSISTVTWHPHDHIFAFCGYEQDVQIWTWDEKLPPIVELPKALNTDSLLRREQTLSAVKSNPLSNSQLLKKSNYLSTTLGDGRSSTGLSSTSKKSGRKLSTFQHLDFKEASIDHMEQGRGKATL